MVLVSLLVDHGILLPRTPPFGLPCLTYRCDVELVPPAVPHLLDFVLHTCRYQAISLCVRYARGHIAKLLVRKQPTDFRTDLCAKALAFRDRHPLREGLESTPEIYRENTDLLIQGQIADNGPELGDFPRDRTGPLGEDKGVITFVQDTCYVAERLPQTAGTFYGDERGEVVHIRSLVLRVEPVVRRRDCDRLICDLLAK